MSKKKQSISLLQTRKEVDVVIPHQTPSRWNLSLFPNHVRLYALGRNGQWTCKGNANTPYRVNRSTGNTECMSVNSKDCLIAHPRSCQKIRESPPPKLKPLSCGSQHMKVWDDRVRRCWSLVCHLSQHLLG